MATKIYTATWIKNTTLEPLIESINKLSDGSLIPDDPTPYPVLSHVASGLYKFDYDPSDDVEVVVDSGDVGMTDDRDRYRILRCSPNDQHERRERIHTFLLKIEKLLREESLLVLIEILSAHTPIAESTDRSKIL